MPGDAVTRQVAVNNSKWEETNAPGSHTSSRSQRSTTHQSSDPTKFLVRGSTQQQSSHRDSEQTKYPARNPSKGGDLLRKATINAQRGQTQAPREPTQRDSHRESTHGSARESSRRESSHREPSHRESSHRESERASQHESNHGQSQASRQVSRRSTVSQAQSNREVSRRPSTASRPQASRGLTRQEGPGMMTRLENLERGSGSGSGRAAGPGMNTRLERIEEGIKNLKVNEERPAAPSGSSTRIIVINNSAPRPAVDMTPLYGGRSPMYSPPYRW